MMKEFIPTRGTINNFVIFESMQEQIDEALKHVNEFPGVYDPTANSDWVGRRFSSWKDAGQKAMEVWPEGIAIYEKMMSELRGEHLPQPTSLRRRAVWGEDGGDEVDIDRLRAAQPYWRTTRRDHRPGPMTVTILTEMTTMSSSSTDKILWRGAATVCLTELLEAAGYRVEIWAVNNVHGSAFRNQSSEHHTSATCYKRTTDPLDVSTLISGVSGWYYRSITLGSYFIFGKCPSYGLGRCRRPNAEMVKRITPDEKALYASNIWSHSDAVSWVKTQLQNFK